MIAAAGTLTVQSAYGATLVVGEDAPTLKATLAKAADGDIVEVPVGRWKGPITIDKPITLRGRGHATGASTIKVGATDAKAPDRDAPVIDGGGEGIAVTVAAPGVVVEDLRIENSGTSLAGLPPDACIHIAAKARAAVIRSCTVRKCAFGIWVHETDGARLLDNRVVGSLTGHRSNRGNGIHLFDAKRLVVRGNHVSGGRDGIYVSATEESFIEDNRATQTRYGVHYMFSYSNTVRRNSCEGNGSGYAIMSSHHLVVTDNTARGNEHHGILFRDVQYSTIERNRLRNNGEGLFFYSSTENEIRDNDVRGNAVGVKIWAGSVRNKVIGNRFVGNRRQVFYVSTKDLVWDKDGGGNIWGDYLGWDQDGDGRGDRPYRVDSFTSNLVHRYPAAALLLRSPTLELLGHLEQRLPLLRVATVIDQHPRIAQHRGGDGHRHTSGSTP